MLSEQELEAIAKDPRYLGTLAEVMRDPKLALETLDFVIRSKEIPPKSRAEFQDFRDSLERHLYEN